MILTTIVGSSIFATMSSTAAINPAWSVATGVASIVAASMGAAQTFLRFSQRAEKHRSAGCSYSALKRELEQTLVFIPDDLNTFLNHTRARWDQLNSECPTISTKLFIEAESKASAKLEQTERVDEPLS